MRAAAAALALLLCGGGAALAECRQALALGLDVSGSVDPQEYALQRDGLAAALEAPQVAAALLSGGAPVALTVYEWSGAAYQRVLIPWEMITGAQALARVTARLRGITRQAAPSETGLGAALVFGAGVLRDGPDCALRTLDISGDGKNISGPAPDSAQVRAALGGITVNALVIGSDDRGAQDIRAVDVAELSAYFRARVLHGPDAFVQVAIGYTDYETAMARKLLREIKLLVLGTAPEAQRTAQGETHASAGSRAGQ